MDASVELLVALDARTQPAESGEVLCSGRVVRTVSPSDAYTCPGYAVAIEQFNFFPSDADSPFATTH